MIKTTEPKPYKPSYPELTAIIFSEIVNITIDDKEDGATFIFSEWRQEAYEENVPNELGEMEVQTFFKKVYVREAVPKFISFEESSALKSYIDANFTTELTGDFKEKWYRKLGHLIVKNQEAAYGTTWEFV